MAPLAQRAMEAARAKAIEEKTAAAGQAKLPRRRLNEIYAKPMPLSCQPLPAFIPHNPLSLVRIALTFLSELGKPPASHALHFQGSFSSSTQSVNITDDVAARALWEQGFFGKGNLSRSEPNWLDREMRRLGAVAEQTAEEFRETRRAQRRQMKYERALQERETIEQQRRQEAEELTSMTGKLEDIALEVSSDDVTQGTTDNSALEAMLKEAGVTGKSDKADATLFDDPGIGPQENLSPVLFENREHLQLTPEEAFYLHYGLGVLDVLDPKSQVPLSTQQLFRLLRANSNNPTEDAESYAYALDDPFILRYVVYHHFRSLGWVVRSGVKFSTDFLLYYRGPVFSHAEYALTIIPVHEDAQSNSSCRRGEQWENGDGISWWWSHCVNRIQSHVRKSSLMVYVEIPMTSELSSSKTQSGNIGQLIKKYRIRSILPKRYAINRQKG